MVRNCCVFKTSDTFLLLSAKQLLITNGISCYIPDEQFSSVYPQSTYFSEMHGLYVNEEEEQRAADIIEGYFNSDQKNISILPDRDSETGGIHCPNCFSSRYYTEQVENNGPLAFILRLFGRNIPEEKVINICQICQYEWEPSVSDLS